MKNKFLIGVALISLTTIAYADQKIPMTDGYYNGKYFLLSKTKKGNITTVTYKSIFKAETVYSKMEINCSTNKYRKIGEKINSPNIVEFEDKGNWITAVNGATHYDVIRFACKK